MGEMARRSLALGPDDRPERRPRRRRDDWLIILRLSRQLRRSQTIIHQLVENSINAMAAREMMLASKESGGPFDARELVRRIDEILGPLPRPAELLRGETLWLHSTLDYVYVREGGDWLDVSESARFVAQS